MMQRQVFPQQSNPSEVPSTNSQSVNNAYDGREQFAHNSSKLPKIQPPVADTNYPASAGSHDTPQSVPHFFDAWKSHIEFSQETVSKNINKNHEIPSETEGTFNTVANTAENQLGYEESVETEPLP